MPVKKPKRLVRPGEEYTTDENVELEEIEARPEPPDIDIISREHDQRWHDHFVEERLEERRDRGDN